MTSNLYESYERYIEELLHSGSLASFKSNPAYNHILEHVCPDYGFAYLKLIKEKFGLPETLIQMFGAINDSIGNPKKVAYSETLSISPTSLRYICHALLILEWMVSNEMKQPRVVEVGCGYGGLICALQFFSSQFGITIRDYTCIDLDAPLRLQAMYLSNIKLDFPVSFQSASTFGRELQGGDFFLISNYCFSEIDASLQEQYRAILFPKCAHGFLTWNHIPFYDIGKPANVTPEVPLTGANNKYVRF